jgi:hypothetical protein
MARPFASFWSGEPRGITDDFPKARMMVFSPVSQWYAIAAIQKPLPGIAIKQRNAI